MSEDVYLMPQTPPDDLTAQVVLFVWQIRLSKDAKLFEWLSHYVEQTFRIRARDRSDVARDVVLQLIRNKWWAEDARAWRKYVATLCEVRARQYSLPGNGLLDTIDYRSTQHAVLPAGDRPPYDPSGAFLTVEEASRLMNVSRSTLYSRINGRRVAVEHHAGRTLITKAEAKRLVATPRLKTVISAVAVARSCSTDTARKYVSRLRNKGLSLDEIARRLATSTRSEP